MRNKNRPEGCIAECYIVEEAIEFCTEYLPNVDPIGIPIARTNNIETEGPLPGGRLIDIDRDEWKQAHHYVLRNTQAVQPYIEMHMTWLKSNYPRQSKNNKWLRDEHARNFIYWFQMVMIISHPNHLY